MEHVSLDYQSDNFSAINFLNIELRLHYYKDTLLNTNSDQLFNVKKINSTTLALPSLSLTFDPFCWWLKMEREIEFLSLIFDCYKKWQIKRSLNPPAGCRHNIYCLTDLLSISGICDTSSFFTTGLFYRQQLRPGQCESTQRIPNCLLLGWILWLIRISKVLIELQLLHF